MEPDFSHEDIALVQRDAEMHIGDIGVFIVNGDAFIKELGEKKNLFPEIKIIKKYSHTRRG